MHKCRILFEKTGDAIYISHLDLMRTMQRIFIRAGVSVKHTEGFNPHPKMVFALPLSVGMASTCELMDTELADDGEDFESLPYRLNEKSPAGIKFIKAYEPVEKFKEIAYLEVSGVFEYDAGADLGILGELREFFSQDEIIIEKKTKRGLGMSDIKPGIKNIDFALSGENISVSALVTAQNPTTNPELIVSALRQKSERIAPDFAQFTRRSMLKSDLTEFQ